LVTPRDSEHALFDPSSEIQRRAYGLRDEEYLRLKILTCMLPAI
jgi:hypothetical protein